MSDPNAITHQHIEQRLYRHFGPLHWWPADSPFEVAVGAILTQNTAWSNVESALVNLRQAKALAPHPLAEISEEALQRLIRPAGFFRQKAKRLKHLAQHLVDAWQGDILALCQGPLVDVRARLLALPGVGPETADSILLYAAGRPSFVVDNYTRRVFTRIGLLEGKESYEEIRQQFMRHLPQDTQRYNEHHAQIVELAKQTCRKNKPLCASCPLGELCRYGQSVTR